MSDLLYVLLTLASFAGLAMLVGVIDRYLTDDDPDDGPDDADVAHLPGAVAAATGQARS